MSKTLKIKNTSGERVAITGFAAFEPGEVRSVSEEDSKTLLACPFIELETKTQTTPKSQPKSFKAVDEDGEKL